MDTARQVIRWSIPGSILMLTAFLINLLSIAWEKIVQGHSDLKLDVSAPEVALITLASIPVGYLAYQFYYFRDGRVRRFPASVVPVDRAYSILRLLAISGLIASIERVGTSVPQEWLQNGPPPLQKKQRSVSTKLGKWPSSHLPGRLGVAVERLAIEHDRRNAFDRVFSIFKSGESFYVARRKQRNEFYENTKRHSGILRTLLAVHASSDPGKAVVAEYTNLSDLYHGLGATRTALGLGVPVGLIFVLATAQRSVAGALVATGLGGVVALYVWVLADRNRSEVLERLIDVCHQGLYWILSDSQTPPAPAGSTS